LVHKSAKPEPVHLPDDSIADRTRGEVRALRAEVLRLQEENRQLKEELAKWQTDTHR